MHAARAWGARDSDTADTAYQDDDDDDAANDAVARGADANSSSKRLRVGAHVIVRDAGDDDAATTLLGGLVGE